MNKPPEKIENTTEDAAKNVLRLAEGENGKRTDARDYANQLLKIGTELILETDPHFTSTDPKGRLRAAVVGISIERQRAACQAVIEEGEREQTGNQD